MFVLTVDQRASRKTGDKVPLVLEELSGLWPNNSAARPRLEFTRTVGDEFQGLVDTPQEALAVVRALLRTNEWYVGIGVGSVNEPLPQRSPDATGEAFVNARQAVDSAKAAKTSAPVSVVAKDPLAAQKAEALLSVVGLIWQSRSPQGWEAVDHMINAFAQPAGLNQREVAAQLGVSSAAISKRLKAAAFEEERKIYPLLLEVLENTNAY